MSARHHEPLDMLPPVDDTLLLAHLAGCDPGSLPEDLGSLLALISRSSGARVTATTAIALRLREDAPLPLRGLVVIARDLLSGETEQTCEAVSALIRGGWYGGTGELLAAARSL